MFFYFYLKMTNVVIFFVDRNDDDDDDMFLKSELMSLFINLDAICCFIEFLQRENFLK